MENKTITEIAGSGMHGSDLHFDQDIDTDTVSRHRQT